MVFCCCWFNNMVNIICLPPFFSPPECEYECFSGPLSIESDRWNWRRAAYYWRRNTWVSAHPFIVGRLLFIKAFHFCIWIAFAWKFFFDWLIDFVTNWFFLVSIRLNCTILNSGGGTMDNMWISVYADKRLAIRWNGIIWVCRNCRYPNLAATNTVSSISSCHNIYRYRLDAPGL